MNGEETNCQKRSRRYWLLGPLALPTTENRESTFEPKYLYDRETFLIHHVVDDSKGRMMAEDISNMYFDLTRMRFGLSIPRRHNSQVENMLHPKSSNFQQGTQKTFLRALLKLANVSRGIDRFREQQVHQEAIQHVCRMKETRNRSRGQTNNTIKHISLPCSCLKQYSQPIQTNTSTRPNCAAANAKSKSSCLLL